MAVSQIIMNIQIGNGDDDDDDDDKISAAWFTS